MTSSEVVELIAEALSVDASEINENTTASDIEMWDSIGVVNLVAMLDEKFNIELRVEEMEQVTSVNQILELLRKNSIRV